MLLQTWSTFQGLLNLQFFRVSATESHVNIFVLNNNSEMARKMTFAKRTGIAEVASTRHVPVRTVASARTVGAVGDVLPTCGAVVRARRAGLWRHRAQWAVVSHRAFVGLSVVTT